MAIFKDNFSKQSDIYAKYRPHYPAGLFSYLSSLTKQHEVAWDCGTGNGQAAIGLAAFYDKVIATDASEQQIKNALPNENVTYLIEKADHTSIRSDSVDLLTIANALHWFKFDEFYREVSRVLKNDGVIAAWMYGLPIIEPEIDKIIRHFQDYILGTHWPPELRFVAKKYATIPFPFQQISSPEFYCEKTMNLNGVIGYLNTWSATQRFMNENKFNPTADLQKELAMVWNPPGSEKTIRWKLTLKVGRAVR